MGSAAEGLEGHAWDGLGQEDGRDPSPKDFGGYAEERSTVFPSGRKAAVAACQGKQRLPETCRDNWAEQKSTNGEFQCSATTEVPWLGFGFCTHQSFAIGGLNCAPLLLRLWYG
jgi:hypothetical protein